MSGITIALFFVTKQTAVLLTGGALLLCALVGIFVLTQAFGKRLSQFTADLCQTLDHLCKERKTESNSFFCRIKRLEFFHNFIIPGNTVVIRSGNCAKCWGGPCDLLFFRISNRIVEIQHISGYFFTEKPVCVSLKGTVSRASAGIQMSENRSDQKHHAQSADDQKTGRISAKRYMHKNLGERCFLLFYWKKRDCMLNLNDSNRESEAEYHGKYI